MNPLHTIRRHRLVLPSVLLLILAGLALLALIVFLGPDPGAEARARYRAAKSNSNATPASAPDTATVVATNDDVAITPPDPLPEADFTSRPPQPGVTTFDSPPETDLPREANALPVLPPPPVPESLLSGSLPANPTATPVPAPIEFLTIPGRALFRNTLTETLGVSPIVASGPGDTGFAPDKFAPESEVIVVALLDNVITSQTEIPVVAGVWEPFYSGGFKLLDVGDKLIGTAAPGRTRDRVAITFRKIIFHRDRRSVPLQAIATSATDGSVGIPGKVVGSLFLQAIFPVLLEMASGFTETFKQRVLVGAGPVQAGFPNASGGIQQTPTLNNAAISSGQSALDTVSDLLAEDIAENQPYIVLPAGTLCRALLTAPLNTANPDYGQ